MLGCCLICVLLLAGAIHAPLIPTNVSPSTCILPGEYKMGPRRPACLRWRKPRMVFFGSQLIPTGFTDLTESGFFLALAL
jgi:hypothetical protein